MTDSTLIPPDVETDDAPVLAGDHYDDDPQVLDSLVSSEAEPPTPTEVADALVVGPVPSRPKPAVATRLLTQTLTLSSDTGVVQVLPKDLDRKSLTIRVAPGDVSACAWLADDTSKTAQRMGAFVAYQSDSLVNVFDGHTGPLFVRVARTDNDPAGAPVTATVSFIAVTI